MVDWSCYFMISNNNKTSYKIFKINLELPAMANSAARLKLSTHFDLVFAPIEFFSLSMYFDWLCFDERENQ